MCCCSSLSSIACTWGFVVCRPIHVVCRPSHAHWHPAGAIRGLIGRAKWRMTRMWYESSCAKSDGLWWSGSEFCKYFVKRKSLLLAFLLTSMCAWGSGAALWIFGLALHVHYFVTCLSLMMVTYVVGFVCEHWWLKKTCLVAQLTLPDNLINWLATAINPSPFKCGGKHLPPSFPLLPVACSHHMPTHCLGGTHKEG